MTSEKETLILIAREFDGKHLNTSSPIEYPIAKLLITAEVLQVNERGFLHISKH